MTAAIYQAGDTIQITDKFYNFSGTLTDLSAAALVKVYQADKSTQVGTSITSTKIATGTYRASVTLPTTEGIYYIEFSGTAADTTAIRHAEAFTVKFSSST
jgi:hypothetical protein